MNIIELTDAFVDTKRGEELTDENYEKRYQNAKRVIDMLEKRRYPGKFKTIEEVIVIDALCTIALEEWKKTRQIPLNIFIDGEIIKLSVLNIMQARSYQHALDKGLKSKKVIDFVNKETRKYVDYFRAVVNGYESTILEFYEQRDEKFNYGQSIQ